MKIPYKIDRNYRINLCETIVLFVVGTIWVGVVILITVAAVGYENVTVYGDATSFNSTNWLWYDIFIPASHRSQHRNCSAGIISLDDYLATTNPISIYDYQFSASQDSQTSRGYADTYYSNNYFQYCSVIEQGMLEYLEPIGGVHYLASVACNTTADVYYVNGLYGAGSWPDIPVLAFLGPSTNYNVQNASVIMAAAALQVQLNLFAPQDRIRSILRPSLLSGGLDGLEISYSDYYPSYPEPGANTPANNAWILEIDYTQTNTSGEQSYYIFLDVYGNVQVVYGDTRITSLDYINDLLEPTISQLNNIAKAAGVSVNIYELLNWMFVTQYWSLLYSMGQTVPTIYPHNYTFPDSYYPLNVGSTNNIYTNATLFSYYTNYMLDTVIPLLYFNYYVGASPFQPLEPNNTLTPYPTAYRFGYTCVEAQVKSPLSMIVAIITSATVILNASYTIFIYLGGLYQKRRYPRTGTTRNK